MTLVADDNGITQSSLEGDALFGRCHGNHSDLLNYFLYSLLLCFTILCHYKYFIVILNIDYENYKHAVPYLRNHS